MKYVCIVTHHCAYTYIRPHWNSHDVLALRVRVYEDNRSLKQCSTQEYFTLCTTNVLNKSFKRSDTRTIQCQIKEQYVTCGFRSVLSTCHLFLCLSIVPMNVFQHVVHLRSSTFWDHSRALTHIRSVRSMHKITHCIDWTANERVKVTAEENSLCARK